MHYLNGKQASWSTKAEAYSRNGNKNILHGIYVFRPGVIAAFAILRYYAALVS